MSVPATLTRAVAINQVEAVSAWARRHGWSTTVDDLRLRAATYHHGKLVEVLATLDGFPALPPTWRFVQPGTDDPSTTFPQAGNIGGIAGSIFHGNRLICAPWNQLAYGTHGGPHPEWPLTGWQEAGAGYTRAITLADMLDQIELHLRASGGFM